MCEDCVYNNSAECDDCIPYDPVCSLYRRKSVSESEPASDCGAFSRIYEQIMTETQSSHYWAVKTE